MFLRASYLVILTVFVLPYTVSGGFCRFQAHEANRSDYAIANNDPDFGIFITLYHTNSWLIPILRVTRLHNPTVNVYVFVHSSVSAAESDLAQNLADVGATVRAMEDYNTTRFMPGPPTTDKRILNLARFCIYHQAAVEEGITRIMAIDGDIAMFASALEFAASYTEDLVTACAFTAQLLLVNKVAALGKYCNYMASYFSRDVGELFVNAEYLGWSRERYRQVHDMELLELFLHENPTVSRKILCPEAPGVPVCNSRFAGCLLSSQAQAIESFYKLRYDQQDFDEPFRTCSNMSAFHSIVTWRPDSRGIPVPYHRKTGECLPLIHFQGLRCKKFVPHLIHHYRELVRVAFTSKLNSKEAEQGHRRLLHQAKWIQEWLGRAGPGNSVSGHGSGGS